MWIKSETYWNNDEPICTFIATKENADKTHQTRIIFQTTFQLKYCYILDANNWNAKLKRGFERDMIATLIITPN